MSRALISRSASAAFCCADCAWRVPVAAARTSAGTKRRKVLNRWGFVMRDWTSLHPRRFDGSAGTRGRIAASNTQILMAPQVPAVEPSPAAFERLMRQYNQRLFRVARSILKDDADAEDALQDAYLQAYRKLGDFRGEAEIGTWLTRIVINQALMRVRKRTRDRIVVPFGGDGTAQ